MKRLVDSVMRLPRAARWAVLAAVVFGAYFLVVEPLLDLTNRHAAAADAIESNLRRAGELSSDDSDTGRIIATGIRAFGRPKLPTDPSARPEVIHRVVDDVLELHGVENRTKTERSSTLTGERARALAEGGRIERYIVEVSFDAPQEAVAGIIADLERSPEISAVSRVKIDRTAVGGRWGEESADEHGMVRATIAAETWVFIRARPGSAGGGGGESRS